MADTHQKKPEAPKSDKPAFDDDAVDLDTLAAQTASAAGPDKPIPDDDAVDLDTLAGGTASHSEPAVVKGESAHDTPEPDVKKAAKTKPEAKAGTVDALDKKTKELAQEVADLSENLESQKDKYLRLMAEFDNYKRRTGKEYERLIEQAGERLMTDIIDVRDNFDRALAAAKGGSDYPALLAGMELIDGKLTEVLSKHGLAPFSAAGDEFNPELHDALMQQPHEGIREGHIAQVFEKGYKLKGKVIKHAKVVVSAGAPKPVEPAASSHSADDDEATFEAKN